MKLWLDDVRNPAKFGRIGWTWAKSYEEAIEALQTGQVEEISLDHDLGPMASIGQPAPGEKTGKDVVLFMQQHNIWPAKIFIHSVNPDGRKRMAGILEEEGKDYRVQIAIK